jgi:hypothetical protein
VNEGALEKNPEFGKSLANNPNLDQLHTGAMFDFTALPVVEVIKETRVVSKGTRIKFNHKQRRACEVFIRFRYAEGDAFRNWIAVPTGFDPGSGTLATQQFINLVAITDKYVELDYWFGLGFPTVLTDWEIYLINFPL